MQLEKGTILANRYRIETYLGSGGMAEVYKVWDNHRSTWLAMKILRADLAEDKVFIRRFKREAQTLSALQHPNIVRFYGIEEDGYFVFITMDFIDGTTLRKEIFTENGPFTSEEMLEILRPVCAALNFAHNKGFFHCDVKPGNIMIDKQRKVYLSDFGIARVSEGATATMVGAGTPAYMAPEQIMGKDPTAQTDIYALGIVLFEMITGGERPFTGENAQITGSTAEKVRWEQLHAKPPSIREFNKNAPDNIESLVNRCIEKRLEDRYSSISELVEDLNDIVSSVLPIENIPTENQSIQSKVSDYNVERIRVIAGSSRPSSENKQKGKISWLWMFALFIVSGVILISTSIASNKKIDDLEYSQRRLVMTVTAGAEFQETVVQERYVQTATSEAMNTYLISLAKGDDLVFGPKSGGLILKDDDYVEMYESGVSLRDFVAVATFINPYSPERGRWSYGIIFRHTGSNDDYKVVVTSEGEWRLYSGTKLIEKNQVMDILVDEGHVNSILLVCENKVGKLFVNRNFITTLDLSERVSEGDIMIGVGIINDFLVDGENIEYRDFSVYTN